jgi:hypothetical protein
MKILDKDCGCDARKTESGITNPFQYWLWYRPLREARRLLYRLLSLKRSLTPIMRGLVMGEHMMVAEGHLVARVIRADGRVEDVDLGYNTITDAAVSYLADDFNNASGGADVSLFNNHAWGTGACSNPVACAGTALTTEASEARVSGTRSKPAANQYRSVGQITANGTKTITEWGLNTASSSGTFWSIRCFTGIALVVNDAIEFTYTVTFSCVQG